MESEASQPRRGPDDAIALNLMSQMADAVNKVRKRGTGVPLAPAGTGKSPNRIYGVNIPRPTR